MRKPVYAMWAEQAGFILNWLQIPEDRFSRDVARWRQPDTLKPSVSSLGQ